MRAFLISVSLFVKEQQESGAHTLQEAKSQHGCENPFKIMKC